MASNTLHFKNLLEPSGSLLSGSLVHGTWEYKLSYWPVELSRLKLAILSNNSLEIGDTVRFQSADGPTMVVSQVTPAHGDRGLFMFSLISTDLAANLEAEVRMFPELKHWSFNSVQPHPASQAGERLAVRAARFRASAPLQIIGRSFGTAGEIDFVSENVSKSGLLLTSPGTKAVPRGQLAADAVVELTIDPDCRELSRPVKCLVRIVRVQHGASPVESWRWGVRILDMDMEATNRWIVFVESLERNQLINATAA